MRSPNLLTVIVLSTAVGLFVLFDKRPGRPPISQPTSVSGSATSGPPLAPAPVAAKSNSTTSSSASETTAPRLPPWNIPDPEKLPDDSVGRLVRYGRDLIAHTSALIGPDAKDGSMRYSGNGLECQSCHLEAGTRRFGLPLAGVWAVFPTFIGREDEVRTVEERINGCMERSMNGRSLPEGGPEMKAMLAYIKYISQDVPVGTSPPGRGIPALHLPDKASDPAHGAEVYQDQCAVCHQPDGHGKRLAAADATQQLRRYEFPPVWGSESYNDGAGMARSITAADFIRANMPFGTDFEHPVLSLDDAFDVAVFINGQSRPHKPGIESDYPDLSLKPADAAYPPFADPFSPNQHPVGPWPPIQRWVKENAAPHDSARGKQGSDAAVGDNNESPRFP